VLLQVAPNLFASGMRVVRAAMKGQVVERFLFINKKRFFVGLGFAPLD
jgi:hypothetical protein